MGYIVQSIVFDKDKGWDMKTAREWVKNHKEFSKPIKEEETVNTIRVRLFPPKKAEQMGFKDYRMKTLASGDVGIMLDIAYNKMNGGANEEYIEYEEEVPLKQEVEKRELKRKNLEIVKALRLWRGALEGLQDLRSDHPEIESIDRIQIENHIRQTEEDIEKATKKFNENDAEIKRLQRELHPTGGGLTGGMNDPFSNHVFEEEEPIRKLTRFNDRLKFQKVQQNKQLKILIDLLTTGLTQTDRTNVEQQKEIRENNIRRIDEQIKKNNDEIKYHQIGTGGSLPVEDLEALLSKSYSKNPEDYKDFKVDRELSGQRVQVYHNPTTQQTIVAHRGTTSVPNWIENVAYAVSNDKSGKAFQHSKKIQDQAYTKYGKEHITTIGHSKGALHAQEYGKEGKEVITLNKPVNITDALFTRVPKSQTDIRTQYDPVSFLRPFQRGSKVETIKSTTKNPLKEHQTSVLGRLDPRKLFGSSMMCDCCGVNCNCGAIRGGAGLTPLNMAQFQELANATTSQNEFSNWTKFHKFIQRHGGNADVIRQRLVLFLKLPPYVGAETERAILNEFDFYVNYGQEEEGAGRKKLNKTNQEKKEEQRAYDSRRINDPTRKMKKKVDNFVTTRLNTEKRRRIREGETPMTKDEENEFRKILRENKTRELLPFGDDTGDETGYNEYLVDFINMPEDNLELLDDYGEGAGMIRGGRKDMSKMGAVEEGEEQEEQMDEDDLINERALLIANQLSADPNMVFITGQEIIRARNNIRNTYREALDNYNTSGKAEQIVSGLKQVYTLAFQESLMTPQLLIGWIQQVASDPNIPNNELVNEFVRIVRNYILTKMVEEIRERQSYWEKYLGLDNRKRDDDDDNPPPPPPIAGNGKRMKG